MLNETLMEDKAFRRIVVGSTGLGLSLMIASLASIRIGEQLGLKFTWHWTILIWMAATAFWNSRFWSVVWDVQTHPSPAGKKKLGIYCAILMAIGVAAFLYPVRFISQAYRLDISKGLITAVIFLGCGAWVAWKLVRCFLEHDEVELQEQGQNAVSDQQG